MQISEVAIDDSTNTVNAGDIYSVVVTLADGQNIGAEYEAGTNGFTVDAAGVAEGLADAFNNVTPGGVIAAHAGTDEFFTLTDQNADNGGFSVTLGQQGAIDGTGASSLLTLGAATFDDADADTITDFATGEDTISLGITDGTSGNYFEDAGQDNWTDAFNEANNQFDGTTQYYLTSTPDEEGLLFFDANADGEADGVVQLTGVDASNFDYTDIVA